MGAGLFLVVSLSLAAAQVGPFGDVPEDAYYATAVAELDGAGVFVGTAGDEFLCPGGFCPADPINRATMAVWVVRLLDGQDPEPWTGSRFDDVDCCLAAFWPPFIERMAELGVTRGCGDGNRFCPFQNTTRAEMAAFLARAFDLPDGPDPGFSDVPADAWYAADVARLRASGITKGCGDGTRFCPSRITTRAEMATSLHRALNLDGDQTGPGEPRLRDLVEPSSEYELLAYAAAPVSGNIDIEVHYCAAPGRYSSDDLDEEVARLNGTVGEFFWRESSGALNLTFVPGSVNEPDNVGWNSETLNDVRPDRGEHECQIKQRESLVLLDLPVYTMQIDGVTFKTVGFSGYNRSSAYAVTEGQHSEAGFNSQRYLETVAHELGHSILSLCHPHEMAIDGSHCYTRTEQFHGNEYGPEDFIEYHNEFIFDENDVSIMSYKDALSRQQRREYDFLEHDFINCRQRYIKEFDLVYSDGTSCQGAPVIDPSRQESIPVGRTPEPPNYVSAISRDSAVLVTWEPPRSNGGRLLTGYEISYLYRDPRFGYLRVPLGSTSNHRYLIENLTNGVEYTVEVHAVNAVGRGKAGIAAATPRRGAPVITLPGPVTNIRVERGQRSITIRWDPPANDGGSPITVHHVAGGREWDPQDIELPAWWARDLPATATSVTYNVSDDSLHGFEVTPRNTVGIGPTVSIKARRAPSDKRITLKIGPGADNHPDCAADTTGCARIKATLGRGFGSGPWQIKCATKDLPRSRSNNADPTNHEVWKIYTTSNNPTDDCIFGYKGETVYIIINDIRSDELKWDIERINTEPVFSES